MSCLQYNYRNRGSLTFDPLTLVPIQVKLMKTELLTQKEVKFRRWREGKSDDIISPSLPIMLCTEGLHPSSHAFEVQLRHGTARRPVPIPKIQKDAPNAPSKVRPTFRRFKGCTTTILCVLLYPRMLCTLLQSVLES